MTTPIIDVHAHIFSALDIPLEGYLMSRRKEHKLGLLLDPVTSVFPLPQLFGYVANRARERCVTRQLPEPEKRGRFYTFMLQAYGLFAAQRFLDWEDSLSSSPATNAELLMQTFPDVDLFVPLMIDYEYWFANTMDNGLGEQVDTIYESAVVPIAGKMHPFVPFDPARELAYRKGMVGPDGQMEPDWPLKLLRNAIREKGFIGVKLYNSLGYRPLHNGDSEVSLKRRRIAVRNNKLTYCFDGEEYDEVLCDLYQYCVDNEVPITAHCVMDGIEAYPDASLDFCAPEFWRPVLQQSRFKDLRLNLAHFGWKQKDGQGFDGTGGWARTICELIRDFDNVYTDVSHHRVLGETGRREFVDQYRTMQDEFAGCLDKIRSRLLYGSDWHVLRRLSGHEAFPESYSRVMLDSALYDATSLEAFLGGNAMEFLGLAPGAGNHQRLEEFYSVHGVPPPRWFTPSAVGLSTTRPDKIPAGTVP